MVGVDVVPAMIEAARSEAEGRPFQLDSHPPSIPIHDFVASETRFAILERTHPDRAAQLAALVQADADERWRYYEQLAGMQRAVPHVGDESVLTAAVDDADGAPDEERA